MQIRAVLLVNLGSPAQPQTKEVRSYLNQFLMDKYVIQLPWPLRRLLVSLFILPSRSKKSALYYKSVWSTKGSPLIVLSKQLKLALQAQLNYPVEMAMRYGNPSIESRLLHLAKQVNISEVLLIPLYPHYAESTVTTAITEAKRVIEQHKLKFKLNIVPPFYNNPSYISALVNGAKPYLQQPYDYLLFSYHSLPEAHITQLDKSNKHCLKITDCCKQTNAVHKTCYRHQVMLSTNSFATLAGLNKQKYSLAFQSSLGKAKWLAPSTEDSLRKLAQNGAKKVLVICPSFVTDCLETLGEIKIRGQTVFKKAGGESLTLIPCLNSQPEWIKALASWCDTK